MIYLFCFFVFLVHTEVSEMFQSSRNIAVKTCIMLSIICYCMGGESTVYVLGCVAALWKLAIFCVKCPVLGSQSSWQFPGCNAFLKTQCLPFSNPSTQSLMGSKHCGFMHPEGGNSWQIIPISGVCYWQKLNQEQTWL